MEYANTLKGIAQFNQEKEQWDQALEKIESTRQVIFELQQVIPPLFYFLSTTLLYDIVFSIRNK